MKISFHTIGCKLNQAETEELKKAVQKMGFLVVPFKEKADVAVIRACGVTCGASRTTRAIIRQAKRRGAYVIVTGCLENKNLPEIDFVARSNEKIIKHLQTVQSVIPNPHSHGVRNLWPSITGDYDELSQGFLVVPSTRDSLGMTLDGRAEGDNDDREPTDVQNRTRAFIKIQTGCNFNCAYCVIPSFRGRTRSVPAKEIIKKIKQAEKDDFKEVILTGVNICLYKDGSHHPSPLLHKEGSINLAGLLKRILADTKIPRIRLGSLDPRLISNEFIKLFSPTNNLTIQQFNNSNRLLPHWHLSLQSGSDEVLKKMRRGYTTKQYESLVKKIRRNNPLFSLTTDIIVGFPSETEKDFKATCDFVKKIKFTKVHVFPFSLRPGTIVAKVLTPMDRCSTKMPGAVPDKIKTERVKKLILLADQASKKFLKKFVGLTRPVLFENNANKKSALWSGYTPEYFTVKYESAKNLQNKIVKIKITASSILQ